MSWCLRLILVFEFDPIFQSWLMVDVHGGSSIWRFYFYFYFRILVWCFDFSQCPFQSVHIHVCQALLASCCFICRFVSFVWLNTKGEPESSTNGKGNQKVSQPLFAHRKDGYKYTGVMGVCSGSSSRSGGRFPLVRGQKYSVKIHSNRDWWESRQMSEGAYFRFDEGKTFLRGEQNKTQNSTQRGGDWLQNDQLGGERGPQNKTVANYKSAF